MNSQVPPFSPGDWMFDKIEKQMRQLQQRIEELEKLLREAPDHFSDDPDKEKSQEQEKPIRPGKKEQQRV